MAENFFLPCSEEKYTPMKKSLPAVEKWSEDRSRRFGAKKRGANANKRKSAGDDNAGILIAEVSTPDPHLLDNLFYT